MLAIEFCIQKLSYIRYSEGTALHIVSHQSTTSSSSFSNGTTLFIIPISKSFGSGVLATKDTIFRGAFSDPRSGQGTKAQNRDQTCLPWDLSVRNAHSLRAIDRSQITCSTLPPAYGIAIYHCYHRLGNALYSLVKIKYIQTRNIVLVSIAATAFCNSGRHLSKMPCRLHGKILLPLLPYECGSNPLHRASGQFV